VDLQSGKAYQMQAERTMVKRVLEEGFWG